MANNGTKNSNDSQFFITLGPFWTCFNEMIQNPNFCNSDRADELHGKHTVFGRCIGDTVYSKLFSCSCELPLSVCFAPPKDVVKIGEMGTLVLDWLFTYLTDLGCRNWRWWATSLVSHCYFLSYSSFQLNQGCKNSPPKIKSIKIIDNPFDDIVPRITAAEKREQQRAREAAQLEREEEQRRKGAKK